VVPTKEISLIIHVVLKVEAVYVFLEVPAKMDSLTLLNRVQINMVQVVEVVVILIIIVVALVETVESQVEETVEEVEIMLQQIEVVMQHSMEEVEEEQVFLLLTLTDNEGTDIKELSLSVMEPPH
jgi:hypothetical protein